VRLKKDTLLTFGGAYSNHIYATAAAARELSMNSIGIIRGEETRPINSTLTFAKSCGMEIHYINRSTYREKAESDFVNTLVTRFGDFFLIPEGGTNELALAGCAEFSKTLSDVDYDQLFLPVGTGGTLAGVVLGLLGTKPVVGVSVLKGDFLINEVETLIQGEKNSEKVYGKWSILTSYHHGGYGRVSHELVEFMREMRVNHDLPLDPVYTGKLLWAVMEEVKRGSFKRGTTILAVHTGGLQGALTQ